MITDREINAAIARVHKKLGITIANSVNAKRYIRLRGPHPFWKKRHRRMAGK